MQEVIQELSFARGLHALTYRPMMISLPPDEQWVVIGYRTEDGQDLEYREDWLVSANPINYSMGANSASSGNSFVTGLDLTTDLVRNMKKILFVPESVIEGEQRLVNGAPVKDSS